MCVRGQGPALIFVMFHIANDNLVSRKAQTDESVSTRIDCRCLFMFNIANALLVICDLTNKMFQRGASPSVVIVACMFHIANDARVMREEEHGQAPACQFAARECHHVLLAVERTRRPFCVDVKFTRHAYSA